MSAENINHKSHKAINVGYTAYKLFHQNLF